MAPSPGEEPQILSLLNEGNRKFFLLGLKIMLGIAVVVVLLQPLLAPDQVRRSVALSLMAGTIALSLWFARRDRMGAAVRTVLFGGWLVVTGSAVLNGGVYSASLFAYPLILAVGGWVFGLRTAMLLGAMTIAAEAGLALAGWQGLIHQNPAPPQWQWLVHAMLVVATVSFVSFSIRAYEDRLEQIRRLSRELTEKVAALEAREAELQRSESKFAHVFHASPVAISITRVGDGLCVDINDAYLRQFGWTREEVIGHTTLDIGLWPSPEARQRWIDRFHADGGHTRDFEHVLLTRTGEPRTVLASSERVRIDEEEHVLVYVNDITEQRRNEEKIRQLNSELEERVRRRTLELTEANQELESFAYTISHDLRAPLRGIDGFSRLLQEEYGPGLDDQGREYLARVRRASQRMGSLIDDLLELSRVTRQEMHGESVDLSAIATDVIANLKLGEPARAVAVRIEPDCRVAGDPQLLRVLLENLLGNAWKYTGRTAAAEIAFGREKVSHGGTADAAPTAAFFVRDNGAGFDMAYADKLFIPFQRLHTPGEFEGSGIGLASAWRVVRRHGGTLWAEAAPGRGATFRFELPAPADGTGGIT